MELRSFTFIPFDAGRRERIFSLFDPATGTVDRICQMNFALGEWFAAAALQAIAEAGLTPSDVALIGSHGQTIFAPGLIADLALLTSDLQVAMTIVQGQVAYSNVVDAGGPNN